LGDARGPEAVKEIEAVQRGQLSAGGYLEDGAKADGGEKAVRAGPELSPPAIVVP
jgi:hypothetical protein